MYLHRRQFPRILFRFNSFSLLYITRKYYVYYTLYQSETFMGTGGSIDRGEGFDEVALERSYTLDDSFRLVTCIIFNILEYLLEKIQNYYKYCSNKLDYLNLYHVSTDNIDLPQCFKNPPDSFSEHKNIMIPTKPDYLVLQEEYNDYVVMERLGSILIEDTRRLPFSETSKSSTNIHLV